MRQLRILALFCMAFAAGAQAPTAFGWPETVEASRPWTYWWWMGSAVDEANLEWCLENYAEAGLGGAHVIPIYGVQGEEARFLDFLSPEWTSMLRDAVSTARALGMDIDMSTGTGWPFGGPQVTPAMMATKAALDKFTLEPGQRRAEPVSDKGVAAVVAYGPDGAVEDVTVNVNDARVLEWTAPTGSWTVYVMAVEPTGQQVKRAAPGAKGHVLDPFSPAALREYVKPYDAAFGTGGTSPALEDSGTPLKGGADALPRAQYHDSYEYHGANWTGELFARFEAMHGYDVRRALPALAGDASTERVAQVRHDYRASVAALLESYIREWVAWSHDGGFETRNQAHGSPGNLLDLYAAADIPETEIFGPTGFPIPGLRTGPAVPDGAKPNPLMMKFASSAAHVTGKPLVSAEACTWMAEHFQEALSQAKVEIDQLLVGGINHIIYHGIAYSPQDADWPGWLFYASTNFGPTSPFWRDFRPFNDYVARCQSVLREGAPDNDVLLYFPIHDIWQESETEGWIRQLGVHNIEWMKAGGLLDAATLLWERGYTFDYVSDAMLMGPESGVRSLEEDGGYKALVIPDCRYLPLAVVEHVLSMVEDGATVVALGNREKRVPGLQRQEEQTALDRLLSSLEPTDIAPGVQEIKIGAGRIIVGGDLELLLAQAGVEREPMTDLGLEFIRRKTEEGRVYFITNLGSAPVDQWVPLGVEFESAVLMDPLYEERVGLAATSPRPPSKAETGTSPPPPSKGEKIEYEYEYEKQGTGSRVYLQLAPGQSIVLKTYARAVEGGRSFAPLRMTKGAHAGGINPPSLRYQRATSIRSIAGPWTVTFLEGGPELPEEATVEKAASWTTFDGEAAKNFSGTARYSTAFELPTLDHAEDWVLDLGDVRESARVRVNGTEVATLFSIPFRVSIGQHVKPGTNTLDVEVTSTGANRIAELDRRRVDWKKFYEINFVDIKYKPFDASAWAPMPSGLLGPVRVSAMTAFDPNEDHASLTKLASVAEGWRGEILAEIDQSYVGWDVEIGDADNDGKNEVLVTGCPDSRLYLLKKLEHGWSTRLLAQDLARRAPEPGMGLTVKVVDLNRDGRNELIVGTGQEGHTAGPAYFYVMETDGWTVTRQISTQAFMNDSLYTHNFGVADIDGDGVQEVISAYCGTGEITRYDVNAELSEVAREQLHVHSGSGEDSFLADIDNDGRVEYLTADCYREGEARVHIFELDDQGDLVKPARITLEGYDDVKCFNVSIETGDVDNDGTIDLIAIWKERSDQNAGTILGYTVDENGATVKHTFTKQDPALDLGYGEKMMVVADADNDGKNDLIVTTRGEKQWNGGGLGHVFMYKVVEGAIQKTLLADFNDGQAEALWPAVGDADNDGLNEIILATGRGPREQVGTSHVVLLRRR